MVQELFKCGVETHPNVYVCRTNSNTGTGPVRCPRYLLILLNFPLTTTGCVCNVGLELTELYVIGPIRKMLWPV
jgi:hypothetical protein